MTALGDVFTFSDTRIVWEECFVVILAVCLFIVNIKVAANSIVSIYVTTKYERRTHKEFKTGFLLSEVLRLDSEP
jgi:hypothetical protein